MSDADKNVSTHSAIDKPSAWVVRFAPLIPDGEVLDLACGAGRHARLLANMGRSVLALDRSADQLAIAAGEGIKVMQVDLENGDENSRWPFEQNRFAGIVVTNYLFRGLFDSIVNSLAPDGVLIYETFAKGNEQFGKPSRPDFLLANGELLGVANKHALHVIAYENGYVTLPKPAMLQRICLIKPGVSLKAENLLLM